MTARLARLTIGELARQAGVSAQTLRHYDRLGLLRACYQAAKTGLDSLSGLGHCNMALNNQALIIPDRVATLVNRGVILHQLKRVQPALDDFNAALRIDPDQADAYLNRGVAKITLGQYADALVDIQKGIDLGPSEIALGYYDRAIAHERLGNIREAYFDYQRALKAAPNFTAMPKKP